MQPRNQFDSGKSAHGAQQLKLMSSTIPHGPCSLKESVRLRQVNARNPTTQIDELNHSTQATQPRNQFDSGKSAHGAKQLKLTSSPFYSGHAAHESIQLRRTAHGASAAQFEKLNCSTHTHNSGHAIHEK